MIRRAVLSGFALALSGPALACTTSSLAIIRPYEAPAGDSLVWVSFAQTEEVALFEAGGAEIPGTLSPELHEGRELVRWTPDAPLAVGTEVELRLDGRPEDSWTVESEAVVAEPPAAVLSAEQMVPGTYGAYCQIMDHGMYLRADTSEALRADVALYEIEVDVDPAFAAPMRWVVRWGRSIDVAVGVDHFARARTIGWDGATGPWTEPVPFVWTEAVDTGAGGDTGGEGDGGADGCGCATGGGPGGSLGLLGLLLLFRRTGR